MATIINTEKLNSVAGYGNIGKDVRIRLSLLHDIEGNVLNFDGVLKLDLYRSTLDVAPTFALTSENNSINHLPGYIDLWIESIYTQDVEVGIYRGTLIFEYDNGIKLPALIVVLKIEA